MTTIRRTAFVLRRFSSAHPSSKFSPDKFGSLERSDIRVERLSYPRSQDFEFPVSKRKVKELSVPTSLSKSKREQLEKLQSREPPPPSHLCFIQCSRPEFNLLESNPSINHSLCSQYWEKNKYSDDWFVIKRTTKEAPSQFAKWENAWEHYVPDRLDPLIRDVIADLGLKTPTYVQLILDEADMILDESFTDVLTEIFALIPIANSVTNTDTSSEDKSNGARVIFCSASCPEELECLADGVVDRQFLRYIKSPKLHSLSHNVEMKFIRVREKDKITRLTELLSEDMKRGGLNQTIVFCKFNDKPTQDRATAVFVHQQLQSFEHDVALWKSPLPHDNETRIFIATDVAARIGRVGRLSSSFLGRVTSFVRTPSEVRLTNVIELAARLGRPLSNIEADVSGQIRRAKENEDN
ncbi:hypothetical protein ANCCEY_04079 [Ancylostoma ceylanicum]|uniref:Helicase C-terminal domain-containing protein n=1 Tax=Ancylostoma ceylanicum TaxID=53326 RepID=A0A0D6MA99_9BILA|nr:hypothetical protein ANCCEY_04079 [Ancylostoma ceylanicum]